MDAYHVDLPDVPVKLNQNEMPYDFPAAFKDRVLRALASSDWNRYPKLRPEDAHRQLAQMVGVKPEMVLAGKGSNEMLQTLAAATIEPGDVVLTTPPTFSLFKMLFTIYPARMVDVPLGPRFEFPTDEVIATAQREKPKLLFIVSPNNPTGTWVPPADIRRIVAETDALVVVDQAYIEFGPPTDLLSLLDEFDNVLFMRTFSKAFHMAGVRLGYTIANPSLIRELDKVLLPFKLDHFTEIALDAASRNISSFRQAIEKVLEERLRVETELRHLPSIEVYPSEANFLLYSAPKGSDLFSRLLAQGVLIRPFGELRPGREFLRVSIGTEAENEAFLRAMRIALRELAEVCTSGECV